MVQKINKKSEEYKQGLIDGYKKARKDFIKIKKKSEKEMKPIKESLRKLRRLSA